MTSFLQRPLDTKLKVVTILICARDRGCREGNGRLNGHQIQKGSYITTKNQTIQSESLPSTAL